MKRAKEFASQSLCMGMLLCCICIFSSLAYGAWIEVDWNSVTSGLSDIDKKVITDRLYAKLGSSYFRAIYVSGQVSPIYSLQKSDDGGHTWKTLQTFGSFEMINNIDVVGSDIYLSRSYRNPYSSYPMGFLYKSSNGGTTWQKVAENGMYSILGVASLESDVYYIFGIYLGKVGNLEPVSGPNSNGQHYSKIRASSFSLYIQSWGDIHERTCGSDWKKIGADFDNICIFESQLYGFNTMGKAYKYIPEGVVAPTANFAATSNMSSVMPFTTRFIDMSTGLVCSWLWNFGDGSSSIDQNPSHRYERSGVYTVALTVVGPGGRDTETKVDYISVGNGRIIPGIPLLLNE